MFLVQLHNCLHIIDSILTKLGLILHQFDVSQKIDDWICHLALHVQRILKIFVSGSTGLALCLGQ